MWGVYPWACAWHRFAGRGGRTSASWLKKSSSRRASAGNDVVLQMLNWPVAGAVFRGWGQHCVVWPRPVLTHSQQAHCTTGWFSSWAGMGAIVAYELLKMIDFLAAFSEWARIEDAMHESVFALTRISIHPASKPCRAEEVRKLQSPNLPVALAPHLHLVTWRPFCRHRLLLRSCLIALPRICFLLISRRDLGRVVTGRSCNVGDEVCGGELERAGCGIFCRRAKEHSRGLLNAHATLMSCSFLSGCLNDALLQAKHWVLKWNLPIWNPKLHPLRLRIWPGRFAQPSGKVPIPIVACCHGLTLADATSMKACIRLFHFRISRIMMDDEWAMNNVVSEGLGRVWARISIRGFGPNGGALTVAFIWLQLSCWAVRSMSNPIEWFRTILKTCSWLKPRSTNGIWRASGQPPSLSQCCSAPYPSILAARCNSTLPLPVIISTTKKVWQCCFHFN